ncbi:MAG: DUF1073 domain-containing protein [Symploca sp. SIO2C1]|nr:DUF1073 domain-containing protein [Symploca sp. SIO2C1]
MSEFRTDSEALFGAFAALGNPYTGIGTSRSKTENAQVNTGRYHLNRNALEVLPYRDELLRKAVCLYPECAAKAWFHLAIANNKSGNNLPDLMMEYIAQLANKEDKTQEEDEADIYGANDAFPMAAILARQFGKAYILMGIDDGKEFSEPVDKNSIKSIRWLQVYDCWELYPDWGSNRTRQPLFYRLYSHASDQQYGAKIHKSRILPFWGNRLYSRRNYLKTGLNDDGVSVIQSMYDAYVDWLQGIKAGSAMLADYDVFTLGMKGLGQRLLKDQQSGTNEGQQQIIKRSLALDMGKSVVRGIYYDLENEEPGSVTRSYGGAKDIMESLENRWAAASGIPKFKLFGEIGSQGLTNNQGLAMRSEWAILVQDYAHNWVSNLRQLLTYAFFAKDSPSKGKIPESWNIEVPFDLQLTDSERMEYEKLAADRSKILTEIGAIAPEEVRSGYMGSQFSPDYVLSKRDAPDEGTRGRGEGETKETGRRGDGEMERTDDASPVQRVIEWNGLKIGLQYLPFQLRHGKMLPVGYGHIQKTKGADGMALDVYVGTKLNSPKIFAISQHIDGKFDEEKLFIGVDSKEEAILIYKQVMPAEFFGGIREIMRSEIRTDSDELLTDDEWEELATVTAADFLEVAMEL